MRGWPFTRTPSARSFSIQRHTVRAGDADFAGDFRAADDDHRVVGEQREERIDAAIGRARKSCVRHEIVKNSLASGPLDRPQISNAASIACSVSG